MRRVMVLGGSGAGKSTFARKLGAKMGVPAIHMDALFWEPGWVMAREEDFLERVADAVAGDAWVMDGNYSRTWPMRLAHADTVVFLDLATPLRFYRAVRRSIVNHGETRADLAPDCPERIDFDFLLNWVARYRWRARPKALRMMADDGPASQLRRVHLRNQASVDAFLSSIG